jgi:hypothetical protein
MGPSYSTTHRVLGAGGRAIFESGLFSPLANDFASFQQKGGYRTNIHNETVDGCHAANKMDVGGPEKSGDHFHQSAVARPNLSV